MDNTNDNIKKPGKYGIPAPKRAKAIFSDDSIDIGNILIDSMPDPLTEEESRQIYMKMPNLQISKDASQRMQLDELMKLSKIRLPLPHVPVMEDMFRCKLLMSYLERYEDMEHTPAEVVCGNASKFQPVSFDTQIGPDGDISFSVIGESGCGKSTSVKQMLSHYPQVLEIDLGDEGTFIQICWINVQAPLNGNLQELYIAIGHEIDKALDNTSGYYEREIRRRRTVGSMANYVADLIRKFAIGAIFIDEIELLAKNRNLKTSYSSFLTLSNTTKVLLISIGTEESANIVYGDSFAMRRRGETISASSYCRDRGYVDSLTGIIMKYNWIKEDFKPTPEILKVFYKYTMGFISRIVKLWCAVQKDYIKAVDKPVVDAEYIERIARNTFRDEDMETLRESIDRNPLFSVEENAVYFLPENKPVAKLPPKAREYSTQTLIDNTLSKTHSPKLAAAVYERVSRNLSEREDSANWSEIANAIVAVMKTKTGMKLDEDQLVTKVLDRVTKSSRKKTMESVVGEAPAINLSTPSNQAG